jgi:hypothetical protein
MKVGLNIVGAVLVVLGGIWFLQGINVLPGSFMTGQIRWAVYGGIAVIVGIVALVRANHGRRLGYQPSPVDSFRAGDMILFVQIAKEVSRFQLWYGQPSLVY